MEVFKTWGYFSTTPIATFSADCYFQPDVTNTVTNTVTKYTKTSDYTLRNGSNQYTLFSDPEKLNTLGICICQIPDKHGFRNKEWQFIFTICEDKKKAKELFITIEFTLRPSMKYTQSTFF